MGENSVALDGWNEKLFQQYLAWNCRPSRVTGHLRAIMPPSIKVEPIDRRRIRVAALQLEFRLFKNPLEFAEEMHHHIRKAADGGAQLVVFPEYNNLPLLGLLIMLPRPETRI